MEEVETKISQRSKALTMLKRLVIKLGFLLALTYLLFHYVFGIRFVKDNYMDPHLKPGDVALYYRLANTIAIKDVVVYQDGNELKIGRVVAQSGDKIDITIDGELMVNGHEPEMANPYQTHAHSSGPSYPYSVPKDTYFILYDYREERSDSRYHGAIPKSNIKGVLSTLLRVRGI